MKEPREAVEKELVESALRRHGGKITSAATELGVSRPALYELMERLGVARGERTLKEVASGEDNSGLDRR